MRVWGPRGEKIVYNRTMIYVQLPEAAGLQIASTVVNLYNSANYLSAESHLSLGIFFEVNSPRTGPILEGPRGQNCYFKPRISSRPKLVACATTRPPDPTLPSRAHPQDYGSRTTPSNYVSSISIRGIRDLLGGYWRSYWEG